MKSAILVNGVPASGKSTVARALAEGAGLPLLTLDTVKEAFFHHLRTGDRDYNRRLGKASYEAIFALIGDFPAGTQVIVDAWFGFQPVEVLIGHLARAKLDRVVEVWCHAPPDTVAERYLARVGARSGGHLGAEYAPELRELAARAAPLGRFPLLSVETSQPFDAQSTATHVKRLLAG